MFVPPEQRGSWHPPPPDGGKSKRGETFLLVLIGLFLLSMLLAPERWRLAGWAAVAAGLPEDLRLTAEPGRSIVASAAVTCYTIGTIKEIPGVRTYVSVDGGMSDNPRPVLYGSGYEACLARAAGAARPLTATVVGKHCESGDIIVRDAQLPADTAVGDLLVTPVTGAYGHSMASTYNKVPRPPVVFVSGGRARLVVRRESLDDLLRLDVLD